MSEQNEKRPIQFYTVCFPEYDSWTMFHGRLYQVRRDFFESRLASQESIVDYSEGIPAKYTHSISRWGMRWKKKLNGQVREHSCFDPSGSAIVFKDSEARAYGKIVFGKDLNWVCSYYYEKGDGSEKLRFKLTSNPDDNTIALTDYSDGKPVTVRMVARPFLQGSVEQSLINAKLGEPRICAATDQGDFCYYNEDLADRYDQWVAQHGTDRGPLDPVWKMDGALPRTSEPDWYEEQEHSAPDAAPSDLPPLEELGQLQTQLFLQPEAQDGPEFCILTEPFPPETDDGQQDHWVEEMLDANESIGFGTVDTGLSDDDFITAGRLAVGDAKLADLHFEPEPDPDRYAANREVFHMDVPEAGPFAGEPVAEDVQEVIGMIDQMETSLSVPEKPETDPEPAVEEVDLRGIFAEGAMPARYTVAGKKLNSNIVRASDLFRKPEDAANSLSETIAPELRSAKRIVISAQENGSYIGKVVDGLRGGQAPEPPCYRKKGGYGAYHYKGGKIAYDGKPEIADPFEPQDDFGMQTAGSDEAVSADAGTVQEGGIAYSAEDGTIFVGKWKNNIPTGEGSAFDSDGRLIYRGSWKEGKRHGQGTEFAPDGHIVFRGEWKDDKYLNGVYYQKLDGHLDA